MLLRYVSCFLAFCVCLAPAAMGKAVNPVIPSTKLSAQIYGYGSIRQADSALEAVVAVDANLLFNIQTGQQVWIDVRQGQLRGVVKGVHSPVEVTIALDAGRSKVKLSRLHPGQAVIAVIELND